MHVDPAARIVYHALADFILGILVALRFYAQRGRRARSAAMIAGNALAILAWICMVVSLVAFTIEDIAIIKWEKEGANLLDHPYSRKNIKMIQGTLGWVYYTGLWAIKGAFVSLYYDLYLTADVQRKRVIWSMHFTSSFIIITFMLNMLLNSFTCRPLKRIWEENFGDRNHCSPLYKPEYVNLGFATNIASDVLILLTPILLVSIIRFKSRVLLVTIFVVLLGFMTMTAATIRYVQMCKILRAEIRFKMSTSLWDKSEILENALDHTRSYMLWSQIEGHACLLAVCLPPVRAVITKWQTRRKGYTARLSGSGNTGDEILSVCLQQRVRERQLSKPNLKVSIDEEAGTAMFSLEPGRNKGEWPITGSELRQG